MKYVTPLEYYEGQHEQALIDLDVKPAGYHDRP